MKKYNLITLALLCLWSPCSGHAVTIHGVPLAIQMKFLPLEGVDFDEDTTFAYVKLYAAHKWGIPASSIYGYIYNGQSKRNPTEKEWGTDFKEILAKKQDVYLITRPKPQ